MKLWMSSFVVWMFLLTSSWLFVVVHGGSSNQRRGPSTLQICNRGLCYNRKEDIIAKTKMMKQDGIDFCVGSGRTRSSSHCDLWTILPQETYEQLQAIECSSKEGCPLPPLPSQEQQDNVSGRHDDMDVLDDIDLDRRRTWTDEAIKGNCYDDHLGHLFDCNLLKRLE